MVKDRIKKIREIKISQRLFYLLAAALGSFVPVFFLYNRNVAEGILLRHCLLFGAAMAAISIAAYALLLFALRAPGAALILVAVLWLLFWNFGSLPVKIAVAAVLALVAGAIVVLSRRSQSAEAVHQAVALLLCLLFAFNIVPAARTALRGGRGDAKPYRIKSSFAVEEGLPRPNIYWLHMDTMIGFDAIEQFFDDPQIEFKQALEEVGFVINETARLGGGCTKYAWPALFSPLFFDSWLSAVYERHADLTRSKRDREYKAEIDKQGFDLQTDIFSKTELFKALSRAGYTIGGNKKDIISYSEVSNFSISGNTVTFLEPEKNAARRKNERRAARVGDFRELVTEASILKWFLGSEEEEDGEDDEDERSSDVAEPENKKENLPNYESMVERYTIQDSDSAREMERQLRMVKYAADMEPPHFFYSGDDSVHSKSYYATLGRVYELDEFGNKQDLGIVPNDGVYDLSRYHGQWKYGAKQVLAKVAVILENDPDAVIVVQGDHGIHCLGPPGTPTFDEGTFEKLGYDHDDMQTLNKSVISAVRIPAKYGALSQALEPLDITRWLVNTFVGAENYEYLFYQ